MSKDSTSSTYAPHASSPGLSAFAHLNVSASPVSDVPPPLPLSASPQHIQSSTVLPDTPPTDQGQPPAFPPGSISGERPASPTVTDPDRLLRRYSRDLVDYHQSLLPAEHRKSLDKLALKKASA